MKKDYQAPKVYIGIFQLNDVLQNSNNFFNNDIDNLLGEDRNDW